MPDVQKQQYSYTLRLVPNFVLVGIVQYECLALLPLTSLRADPYGAIALWDNYWEMDAQSQIHRADMWLNRRIGLERTEETKGEGRLEQMSCFSQTVHNFRRLGTMLGKFGLPLTR